MEYLECEVNDEVVEVHMMRVLGWLLCCRCVTVCVCGELESHGVAMCDRLLVGASVRWCGDSCVNGCGGNCG